MTPLREVLTGQVRTSVLVLFAGVGVLLAIACFNVASMLLARSALRQRDAPLIVALRYIRGIVHISSCRSSLTL